MQSMVPRADLSKVDKMDNFLDIVTDSKWAAKLISYVKYSNVCARAVRKCLKPELRTNALKRDDDTIIKVTKWEGGKPVAKAKAT